MPPSMTGHTAACASGWGTRGGAGGATRWWWTTNFQRLLQQVGSGWSSASWVIRHEFTMDDPVRRVRQWTAALSLRKIEGHGYEVTCHAGNHSLQNSHGGAPSTARRRRPSPSPA